MKEAYNDYIEKFKDLTNNQKREENIGKVRDMIEVLGNFSTINENLISREIINLKQTNVTESDYLEALFTYLNILEDLVANTIINLQEKR